MVYTLRFFSSSKRSLFHNSNVFGPCIIHTLYTGCAKLKKKFRRLKVNIIPPSTPRSPKWTLSLMSPHLNTVHTSPVPPTYSLHAPPISLFLALSPESYLVRRTEHKAPLYVVFSTPVSSRPSQALTFSSVPYSRITSAHVWIRLSCIQPSSVMNCTTDSNTTGLLLFELSSSNSMFVYTLNQILSGAIPL